jgi:ABC-type transport system involved in multi-copper enzyme maturation permease subunit
MVVLAIVYGAGLLAGEVTKRTSGFLFSKPVSRLQVMLAKYFVALAVLWISAAAGTAAALLGTFAAGQEVPVGWFLTALPATLAGTAFLLALTTFASANASEPLRAGGVMVAGIALLVVLPVLLRPLSLELARQVDFLRRMAGEVSFTHGRIDWGFLLQCLILSVLVLLAAHRRLQVREL